MFEEIDESESKRLGFTPPPFPKVIIIDLSLISGMDTSSYDVFAEIQETLKGHDCKLYLCGLSHRARTGLALVGVKPSAGLRSDRLVRFFQDLDSALGKAEDLLTAELDDYERGPILSVKGDSETGFLRALRQIDDQHGIHLAEGLIELQKHTVPVELKPGQELYRSGGMGDYQRGLFFIESGILKIQRDAGATLTLSRSNIFAPKGKGLSTLNRQHARTGSIGRRSSVFKASLRGLTQQHFRLARIGPGWLVGTIEISTGHRDPGVHIAVGHCRLHHLAFHKVQHIEQETPELATRLYKLISHLMAHRQETTIAQLAALKSIISSPAQTQ
jgi:CRP-like cAMP-binding protein